MFTPKLCKQLWPNIKSERCPCLQNDALFSRTHLWRPTPLQVLISESAVTRCLVLEPSTLWKRSGNTGPGLHPGNLCIAGCCSDTCSATPLVQMLVVSLRCFSSLSKEKNLNKQSEMLKFLELCVRAHACVYVGGCSCVASCKRAIWRVFPFMLLLLLCH